MNEYRRMHIECMNIPQNVYHELYDYSKADYMENVSCVQEQLFAEYLMQAGMIPDYYDFEMKKNRVLVCGWNMESARSDRLLVSFWQSKPLYWKENKHEGKHGE